MLKSLGIHFVVVSLMLLIPAGALRSGVRPKEVDVVFYRPRPQAEIPPPALPPSSLRAALGASPGPKLPPGPPAPRPTPAEGGPVTPEDPLPPGDPDLAPGPEAPAVAEEPPQQKVGKSGILALRDQFASLAKDKTTPNLGVDARYREADDVGDASARTLLTSQTPGSSGGINLASLSRSLGGGGGRGGGRGGTGGSGGGGGAGGSGGSGLGGGVGRIGSPIAPGGDRPLAHGGPGASRTDEEIQIVFDRYKASFYRLYHRQLRNDPSLKGQIVLKLTIEPDGSVSMCVMQSSDMHAPELASQVVGEVLKINFGAKADVQAMTIVYPIDFLPAAEGLTGG